MDAKQDGITSPHDAFLANSGINCPSSRRGLCEKRRKPPLWRLSCMRDNSARVRGCAGARVRGCAGARVRGCAGARVRGCAGARVRGCAGARVRVLPGTLFLVCQVSRSPIAQNGNHLACDILSALEVLFAVVAAFNFGCAGNVAFEIGDESQHVVDEDRWQRQVPYCVRGSRIPCGSP